MSRKAYTSRLVVVKIRKYANRPNYQLEYVDPATGKKHRVSAGTTRKAVAQQAAAKLQDSLNDESNSETSLTWDSFVEIYESQKLASDSKRTRNRGIYVLRKFAEIVGKIKLDQIQNHHVTTFGTYLRDSKRSVATVNGYLGHLRLAFNWANKQGYMPKTLHYPSYKGASGKRSQMRSAPLRHNQLLAMLAACERLRQDGERWSRLLQALWLSGLRLEEAVRLSWDQPPFQVDLHGGEYPRYIIFAEGHKRRTDQYAPITPDFAEFLEQTPLDDRTGHVLSIPSHGQYEQLTPHYVGQEIHRIAKHAGVQTAPGKFASAHDFRRAFGTRWAQRVAPLVLKELMRHATIQTTSDFYVGLDTNDVSEKLWNEWSNEWHASAIRTS